MHMPAYYEVAVTGCLFVRKATQWLVLNPGYAGPDLHDHARASVPNTVRLVVITENEAPPTSESINHVVESNAWHPGASFFVTLAKKVTNVHDRVSGADSRIHVVDQSFRHASCTGLRSLWRRPSSVRIQVFRP